MKGEVVFIYLFDIGRYIDLEGVLSVFPGMKDKKIVKTKDTPDYIDVPETITVEINENVKILSDYIKGLKSYAYIYEDGVISISARLVFENFELEKFHTIRNLELLTNEGNFIVESWVKTQFNKIYGLISNYIDKYINISESPETEYYTCFCINEQFEDPSLFLKENDKYLAALLMGENPDLNLHPSQITNAVSHTFSFLKNDICIFDFERCLIIDPSQDYEDILVIIELANYQLLELRTLDKLLDSQLDYAEDDIRKIFYKSRLFWRTLNKKLGYLFRLRYELIFILENLENISKIIGDYYLAQIYTHLGNLFRFDQWSESIRNRLRILDDIYSTAKTDINERILVILDVMIVILIVVELLFIILGLF